MRPRPFRLKTIMIAIAFLALGWTVILQAVWLQQAHVREERLRAEAEREQAVAVASFPRAQAAVDQVIEQAAQK